MKGWYAEGWCSECDVRHSFGPYRTEEDCDDDYRGRLRAHTPEDEDYVEREVDGRYYVKVDE